MTPDVSMDDTAAWLAFVGALGVALIAAVTAQIRLRAQLRHDRETHEVAELRRVFDQAGAKLAEASDLTVQLRSAWSLLTDQSSAEEIAAVDTRHESETHPALFALAGQFQRLSMRLTPHHPAVTAYWAARNALAEVAIQIEMNPVPTPAASRAVLAAFETAATQSAAFVGHAHRHVRARF